MRDFSELTIIPLRQTWANEAQHFTPWLERNIQKLGDALGFELEVIEREASVGDLSLDLLAKDTPSSRPVIIENQLEPADHRHLGQLLSYAAGLDASVVIWISEDVREEYRQVLDWLNQKTSTDVQFFAVVVEVVQIEGSSHALVFRPIVMPNNWQKMQKQKTGKLSPLHEKRKAYFQKLIDELREKHDYTGAKMAQHYTYHHFATGINGIRYGAMLRADDTVLVYVHIKDDVRADRLDVYEALHNRKEAIEKQIELPLDWIPNSDNENENFSRIAVSIDGSIEFDEDKLETIRAWQVQYLLKFKEVFYPEIIQVMRTLTT